MSVGNHTILFLLGCWVGYSVCRNVPPTYQFPEQWRAWKMDHGKNYTSQLEELERHLVWLSNKKYIETHNSFSDVFGYTLKLNQFADMTQAEFKSLLYTSTSDSSSSLFPESPPSPPSSPSPPPPPSPLPDNNPNLPESMDWRTKNAVTSVSNEGQCVSCYAFAALGALEGALALATGTLINLSAQNIVDCSLPYGNHGCRGGSVENTFNYIVSNGGVDLEQHYPFRGRQGTCLASGDPQNGGMSGFVKITAGDEQELLEAVATVGPVAAAVDATSNAFRFYSSGVLDLPQWSKDNAVHAVLITGYGEMKGKKYWLVRNSWGIHWGDDGYILMSRDKYNQCGIASNASYPTL